MEENKNVETETFEIVEEKELAETTENVDNETAEGQGEQDKKKSPRSMTSSRNGLYLRTVIGALILYYAYTIVADITSTPADERTMLYVFVAVFGIAGLWTVIDSVKRLLKKEYDN